jgi:putative peptidoglycan binding protein
MSAIVHATLSDYDCAMGVMFGMGVFFAVLGLGLLLVFPGVGVVVMVVGAAWAALFGILWMFAGSVRLAGKAVTAAHPPHTTAPDTAPGVKSKIKADSQMDKGIAAFLLVALLGFFIWLVVSDTPGEDTTAGLGPPENRVSGTHGADNPRLNPVYVQAVAQTYVEKWLKSPASAEFDIASVHPQPHPNAFAVIGNVDAQNDFGAMLRNRYMVGVQCLPFDSANCAYEVVKFSLGGEVHLNRPFVGLPPPPAAEPTVAKAQRRLADRGFDPGPADGIMGSKTRSAIRAFQEHHHLPVTGKLDQSTLTYLDMALEKPES